MGKKVPCRNKSPFGWWVASILVRFEIEGEDAANLNRHAEAWENTIIIKAKDRNGAYRKAVAAGKLQQSKGWDLHTDNGCKARSVFDGITSLLPIYEKIEDGAEIIWKLHRRSVKNLKALVKAKQDLECFHDDET
ncbi:DUF4288 domain-containing protein [bacterium]|nr:DUF4288 domain-containing protein [bacterium]